MVLKKRQFKKIAGSREQAPRKLVAPRQREARGSSSSGDSVLRYVPWLILTGVLHYVLLWWPASPAPEELARDEARRAVRSNILQLAAIHERIQDMKRDAAAPPEKQDQEAKTEPEKTEPEKTEPEKTEPEKTEPEKTEPEKTEPEKTEPEKTEPEKTEPDHTQRKPIEGQDSPTSEVKDEQRGEENQASEADGNQNTPEEGREEELPVEASELRRDEWRAVFDASRPAKNPLYEAAKTTWDNLAAIKRGERVIGAKGLEEGMPHIERRHPLNGSAFVSAMDLFGGEVVLQGGRNKWWHLERSGSSFRARALGTMNDLRDLSRRRGLNLGYAIDLEKVSPTLLPDGLLDAKQRAFRDPSFDRAFYQTQRDLRFIWIGTTKEQAAVASKAQAKIRRNRRKYPGYTVWGDAKVITYRYLYDRQNVVYDVEIQEIK